MRRVVIESPYAGRTKAETARNVDYVRAAIRDCLMHGEAPIASHALYTLPGILDDLVPEQRRLGIEAGLVWGALADVTAAYIDLGISPGMQIGIDRARSEGRPVEMRRIPGWADLARLPERQRDRVTA